MEKMQENNPLYKFHFCPICGSPKFIEHHWNARKCLDCGFTYYTNPRSSTVAVILNDQGELLVAHRAKEPAKGTLDLVGGFTDLYETVEEAMCREIKEESGLDIEQSQLHFLFSLPNQYLYSGIIIHTIDMFFEIHVVGRPEFKAMDDVASLQWMPISEINAEDFGLTSVRNGIKKYFQGVK